MPALQYFRYSDIIIVTFTSPRTNPVKALSYPCNAGRYLMASQNTADGPEAVDTISLAPVVANNGTINLRLNQAGLKSLDVEVLKVIDIPFTGIGLPPKILLKGFDSIGPYHRDDGFCKRINQALSLLPPLKASMARIFDVGGYKDGERLHKMQGAINSYLLETYPLLSLRRSVMDSFPGLDLPSSSQVDLRSLLFQWHSSERLYGDLENHYPVCTTTASWYQLGATKQRSSVLCLDYIQDKLIGERASTRIILCRLTVEFQSLASIKIQNAKIVLGSTLLSHRSLRRGPGLSKKETDSLLQRTAKEMNLSSCCCLTFSPPASTSSHHGSHPYGSRVRL